MATADVAADAVEVTDAVVGVGSDAVVVVGTEAVVTGAVMDEPAVVDTDGGTDGPAVETDATTVEAVGMETVVESRVDVAAVVGRDGGATDVVVVIGLDNGRM